MTLLAFAFPSDFNSAMRLNVFVSLIICLAIHRSDQQSGFHPGSPSDGSIPFPQCTQTKSAASFLRKDVIEFIFRTKLGEENAKLSAEAERNSNLNNHDIMDFEELQLRNDIFNGAVIARAATKTGDEIIFQLFCRTNSSVTQQLDDFLKTLPFPRDFCVFQSKPNCAGFTQYRAITGVCNNLQRAYQGSSQTAFGRILPPAYEDGLSTPRSQSVLGGPLPPCRQISLTVDNKLAFDTRINNFWVTYGQFLVHDMTLSIPVSDTGRSPITSCHCQSTDSDMCTVINIASNDPFLSNQRCMAFPTTAQAFSHQRCGFGHKEQMNGNTHYIDLSVTYGSTRITSSNIRLNASGFLKVMRQPGLKLDLLPGQLQGTACMDATETQRCFAGGDSRLMENSVLLGIQTQWLRMHNLFAHVLADIRPDWRANDEILYQETRKVLSALHQHYVYTQWLPILISQSTIDQIMSENQTFSQYDPKISGVVFNEVTVAALRLHSFVRDLVSRCQSNGTMIDQLWFHDIAARCRFAYDNRTNGLDSFICGALRDYSFANDASYAQQIHHRLFETTTAQGEIRRNDIVSMNICRAREHGIPGYNAYRQFCGLPRAKDFNDLSDLMTSESIEILQKLYKHPDDIDLFVAFTHEKHLPNAVVGSVSACILGTQFRHLKYGDRFFYTHQGQFTKEQLNSIKNYPLSCFICHSTDIELVPRDPFRPPHQQDNPSVVCEKCPFFDFSPWKT